MKATKVRPLGRRELSEILRCALPQDDEARVEDYERIMALFDKQRATIKKLRDATRPALDPVMCKQIENALRPDRRLSTTWFRSRCVNVCLRTGVHMVGGKTQHCIDLANIEIGAQYRGRGLLRKLIAFLESLPAHASRPIYVENVHLVHHFDMWRYLGFTQLLRAAGSHPDEPLCFIKYKKED